MGGKQPGKLTQLQTGSFLIEKEGSEGGTNSSPRIISGIGIIPSSSI